MDKTLFRVSKLTDYGMLIMVSLVRQPETVRAAAEIAEATGIAQPTVSKILKSLTRGELVDSFRGVNGGYRLARDAAELSVAQIISALEGPIALTECSGEDDACGQSSSCSLRGNWQTINDAVRSALEQVSLAEFAKPDGLDESLREFPAKGQRVIPILSTL